jgi:hypothetical protein
MDFQGRKIKLTLCGISLTLFLNQSYQHIKKWGLKLNNDTTGKFVMCFSCKKRRFSEEMQGDESELCIDCHEVWFKSEMAYWKPLYEGEKLAGLLEKEKP